MYGDFKFMIIMLESLLPFLTRTNGYFPILFKNDSDFMIFIFVTYQVNHFSFAKWERQSLKLLDGVVFSFKI